MGRVAEKTRLRLEQLKQEYELSEKAARFVDATLEQPDAPILTRAKNAGYTKGGAVVNGYARLKTPKIRRAVTEEIRKRANVKEEMEKLKANPREYLTERFVEHAADPEIMPNQTRALELVGKMEGLFVERIEVDPGQHIRSQTASQYMTGVLPPPDDPVDN